MVVGSNLWVTGGVMHGRGFESVSYFVVNGGVVVHGRRRFESLIFGVNCHGFESLTFAVNGGVITIHKINKANQTPRKPSGPPGLNYINIISAGKWQAPA
jgi:hypothetical protein